ncbi:MAG TPA: hypothetical protein VGC26_09330 [Afipia sp.]
MKLIKFRLPGSDDWHIQPEGNPIPDSAAELQNVISVPEVAPTFTDGDDPVTQR